MFREKYEGEKKMDWVSIGVIRILLLIGQLLITALYYSLKVIIWILNKLRMTGVAIWFVGIFVLYELEMFQNDWYSRIYMILGIIIFVISVFWLLGDIIRLIFPRFSFLDIPDYFSPEKEKVLLLANESEWFNGLNSKKKIQRRYRALKECFIYSADLNEQEKLLQIEKEYKNIISKIG